MITSTTGEIRRIHETGEPVSPMALIRAVTAGFQALDTEAVAAVEDGVAVSGMLADCLLRDFARLAQYSSEAAGLIKMARARHAAEQGS